MGAAQSIFGILAGHLLGGQIDQEHVAVGAPGHDAAAALLQFGGHLLCVGNHLHLVILEAGAQSLFESDGLGSDDVHQRTALDAGKYR